MLQNRRLHCKYIEWKVWSKWPNTPKPYSFICRGCSYLFAKAFIYIESKKIDFSNRYILLVCALHVYRIYPIICNIHHFSPTNLLQCQYASYVYGVQFRYQLKFYLSIRFSATYILKVKANTISWTGTFCSFVLAILWYIFYRCDIRHFGIATPLD